MSKFLSRNRIAGTAVALAIATSVSFTGPAEALQCKVTYSHGEGFHPNKTTALGNAVKDWSIRAKSYGYPWSFWALASNKYVNCKPATGGLVLCKIKAKPCYDPPV